MCRFFGREEEPAELHSIAKLNVYVIKKEHDQLIKVTRLPATAFTFIGNICQKKRKKDTNLPMSPFYFKNFLYDFSK